MKDLWDKKDEANFFSKSLFSGVTPDQLFYLTNDKRYLAYWPRSYRGSRVTLQSRNSLIGDYSEIWCTELFKEIGESIGGYAIQKVICDEISLTDRSPADVAICKKRGTNQKANDIVLIIEVKMSIVWNWEYSYANDPNLVCVGDYRTHSGTPSLLRSDSMLKAIGKSINIRVSSELASRIPIIIIGNSPVQPSYYSKVDHLKSSGVIQGFWSINPIPTDDFNLSNLKSPKDGFLTIDSYTTLKKLCEELIMNDKEYFSAMIHKLKLGEFIQEADQESTLEKKAMRFLELIRE